VGKKGGEQVGKEEGGGQEGRSRRVGGEREEGGGDGMRGRVWGEVMFVFTASNIRWQVLCNAVQWHTGVTV